MSIASLKKEENKMPKSKPSSVDLARTFSDKINEWLDAGTVAEVNRRNVLPEYAGCCATHDFCDPNQAIVESLESYGLEFNHDMIGLINDAWDKAQQVDFVAARM